MHYSFNSLPAVITHYFCFLMPLFSFRSLLFASFYYWFHIVVRLSSLSFPLLPPTISWNETLKCGRGESLSTSSYYHQPISNSLSLITSFIHLLYFLSIVKMIKNDDLLLLFYYRIIAPPPRLFAHKSQVSEALFPLLKHVITGSVVLVGIPKIEAFLYWMHNYIHYLLNNIIRGNTVI